MMKGKTIADFAEAHPPPLVAQRRSDEVTRLRNELRQSLRTINELNDVRSLIGEALSTPLAPPAWLLSTKKKAGVVGTPLLFFSDAQWGEVIQARELDGINAFDRHIASQRYKSLIERAIDIACNHVGEKQGYDGIVYLRGGDMISGEIHAELTKTNDLLAIPSVVDLVQHEVAGVRELKKAFGSVCVISVPGNHGRTTFKPEAKLATVTNYDTLSAWMLQQQFLGDPKVTFQTPLSGDALFKVHGWQWLMSHGDKIGSSGGQGFIGPAATITRGMKKMADYYATMGVFVDYQLVGHYHTPLELEYGWSNGSLPGYSEYAKLLRSRPKGAVQWLLFCHPERGVTSRWQIQLGAPRMTFDAAGQMMRPFA